MKQISTLKLAQWASAGIVPDGYACFMHDGADMPESLAGVNVVMGAGDEARVAELLGRGAERVLLGDLALLDSTAVERLVQQHGSEHIGLWVRAAKRHVTWTLDRKMYSSNADFNCMTPSLLSPGWEALKSDSSGTEANVEWWLGQMFGLGASMALISMDMQDNDLNICAGLNIDHAGKIWFTPLREPDIDLEPWVRWGKVRQLLLPEQNTRDEAEMARIAAPAMIMVESAEDEVEEAMQPQDVVGEAGLDGAEKQAEQA